MEKTILTWNEIEELYNQAKYCLWGSKDLKRWSRDDENGYYYMGSAYHYATLRNPTDPNHLLYARILRMMANELRYKADDYKRFHEFVKPALEEFNKAIEEGVSISPKNMIMRRMNI